MLASDDAERDPLSVDAVGINDGSWRNVSVTVSGTVFKLDYDGQNSSSRNFAITFNFDSLDTVEMTVSGKASLPNDQIMEGK